MTVEFKLPELGENIESGDVVKVLVSPGDVVVPDQSVVELETDKATIEVPVNVGGTVVTVDVTAGDRVRVGQVIVTLDPTASPVTGTPTPAGPAAASVSPGPEGLPVPPGRDAAPTQRQPAPAARVDRAPAQPAVSARRGEVVPWSRVRATASDASHTANAVPAAPAAPSVRRLARELGVEIDAVAGTGPGGRISADDVKAHSKALTERAPDGGVSIAASAPFPDFEKWGGVARQRMSGIRRRTATHLSAAWATIPHVTQHDTADITELEALRRRFDPQLQRAGGRLTVTAIAIKVIASALKQFPQFNASLDLDAEEIVLKQYVHVGVAVDTERGLLVPVVRDVDRRNMSDIALELGRLAELAKAGKLTLEDMSGGCFTITNLGGIGGSHFTPIVNWPEVAILGISRATTQPVYVDGALVPRLILPLSLSYDHRAIDGADAVRFLRWVVGALEQPFLLSLEG